MKMTNQKVKRNKNIISRIMTIIMVFALALPATGVVYAENAPAYEAAIQQDALPEKFDLRDKGVVPAVRNQDPWGTCWAMASTEASQISILSEKNTTFEKEPLVFSPRHLAWFAWTALDDNPLYPTQNGEGAYLRSVSSNIHANPLGDGGFSFTAANLFASGMGPVYESDVPYRNEENMAEMKWDVEGETGVLEYGQTIQDFTAEHPGETFSTYTSKDEEGNQNAPRTARVEATADMIASGKLSNYASEPIFDNEGHFIPVPMVSTPEYDWSVPEEKRFNREYELEEYKLLRQTTGGYNGDEFNYDETAVNDIKKELYAGRGVTVSIVDDAKDHPYFTNTETYSQYTVNRSDPGKIMDYSHAVCIVGWDDNWSKENFKFTTYDDDGNPVEWMPPENGAWIILNSYGAETESFPNEGSFGYLDENGKHTGYLYLSYYDMSISYPASFDFDVTGHISDKIYQYDLTNTAVPHTEKFTEPVAFENVFTAEEDQAIHAVSVETQDTDTNCRLTVYSLKTENGQEVKDSKLAEVEETFTYGGFHRISLENKISIKKGERFAIEGELTTTDDKGNVTYHVPVHIDVNEKYNNSVSSYIIAVVNSGESFIETNGVKTDWKEAVSKYKTEGRFETEYDYDNFALKVYADNESGDKEDTGNDDIITIEKKSSAITIKGKKAAYTGKAIKVAAALVTGSSGQVTYTYYTDAACKNKTSKANGTSVSGGAPSAVGTYYVKASVAEDDNYKAAVSKTVKLTISLGKAEITSLSAAGKDGQVQLAWKKVTGAAGYEIFQSASKKGTYKKVKTVKSGKTLKTTISKLKLKKTYYYKIRAYSGNVKGAFSDVQFIKTWKVYTMTANQKPYNNKYVNYDIYNKKSRQYYVLRSYLDEIEEQGGGVLVIKKGNYSLYSNVFEGTRLVGTLYIPSNTTIKLEKGVKIKLHATAAAFAIANRKDVDSGKKYKKYNGAHDVVIEGPEKGKAVIDRNFKTGNTLVVAHTKNVTVKNLTFTNMNGQGGHYIEVTGAANVKITGNTFTRKKNLKDDSIKEAINIDVPDINTGGFSSRYTSYDCTPDKNVVIDNNVFENVPAAVGSHTYTPGKRAKGIQITNNTMTNIQFYAIRMQNWDSPVVENNVIKNIVGKYDYGEAILIMGVKSPVITGNTVSGASYFMVIRTAKYTNDNVNKNNPRYKKLINYAEAKNDFGESDFERLGFYDNNLLISNKIIRYRNSYTTSYKQISLER